MHYVVIFVWSALSVMVNVACSTQQLGHAVAQFVESLWPWGRLNLYEYHRYFLGVGGGERPMHKADKLTALMCWLSWILGESQPPGTRRACPGLYRDYFVFSSSRGAGIM